MSFSESVKLSLITLISLLTFTLSLHDPKLLRIIALAGSDLMLLHLALAGCITAGLVFIPIGYKLGMELDKNWKLRLTHIILIGLITAETIVGLTCPLTILEYNFRDGHSTRSLGELLIEGFYTGMYRIKFYSSLFIFFSVVLFLWIRCPPKIKTNR